MTYIAHRNIARGQLVFATNNKDNTVQYTSGKGKQITEDIDDFIKGLSGAVIVYQPAEGSSEKEYRNNRQNEILNKLLIPFSLVLCLVVLIGIMLANQIFIDSASNWRFWTILFTKTLGLLTSFFLVQQELKIKNPFTDKICHLSEKTDCNAVLESGSSSVFGWIGWADIGFIYFAGGLVYTLISSEANSIGLLTLLSILVIPYPFYSIYLQAFRLNKFCPLCLAVQITLVTEFIILLPVIRDLTFDLIHVTNFLIVYSLTLVVYVLIREIINLRKSIGSKTEKFFRFKRNPIILKNNKIRVYRTTIINKE